MNDDEIFLLGQIKGRMEQILSRLDRIEETLEQHSKWIAERAGADQVRGSVAGKAWQVILLILGPVVGGAIGAWFAKKGR